ncbi:MAG TPA: hypothetical protein VMR23_08220 [Candidatus Limnocylindria bacterium]|nr:hypothetical protein [Candidatus Limnocylindria bacterium]
MNVLNPLGARSSAPSGPTPLAPRPRSLRGLRIGVLDNSKPNAGVLLGRVAELIAERQGAAAIVRWQKPGASHPAAMMDDIVARADVLLTGSAD